MGTQPDITPGQTVYFTPRPCRKIEWAEGPRKVIRIEGDMYVLECGNIKLTAEMAEIQNHFQNGTTTNLHQP